MSDEELDMLLLGFICDTNIDAVLDELNKFQSKLEPSIYKGLVSKIEESAEFYKQFKNR